MPPKSSKRADLPGADLLFGSPSEALPPSEGSRVHAQPEPLTVKHVNPPAREQVEVHTSVPAGSEVEEEAAPGPVKFTFYFDPSTLEDLEETWMRLRSTKKRKGRRPISKSEIVNAAVKAALEDPEGLLKRLSQ